MTLFQGGWWWWHSPLNSHLNDGVGGPRCQATRWFTYWQLESTCTAGDPRGWIFVSTGTSGNPTKITAPNATKRNKGRIGRWCGSYWMNWRQVSFSGRASCHSCADSSSTKIISQQRIAGPWKTDDLEKGISMFGVYMLVFRGVVVYMLVDDWVNVSGISAFLKMNFMAVSIVASGHLK